MIGTGGVVYALTREQSGKPKTVNARSSGLKQFDFYLKSRNVKLEFDSRDPFKDLEYYMTPELENFLQKSCYFPFSWKFLLSQPYVGNVPSPQYRYDAALHNLDVC